MERTKWNATIEGWKSWYKSLHMYKTGKIKMRESFGGLDFFFLYQLLSWIRGDGGDVKPKRFFLHC